MELNDSKTKIDDMPSFDDDLDSLNFDDSSFLDDSDPAIPIVNDSSDFEKEGDMSFDDSIEDNDISSPGNSSLDLTSDFDVDLNDFSHAESLDDIGESPLESDIEIESENKMDSSKSSPDSDEDEGPIALSEDELENILGDTDSDFESSVQTAEEDSEVQPSAFDSEEDFALPPMTLEDEVEEEEDIALSSSELDNILNDTDTSAEMEASTIENDNLLSDEFDQDFFGEDTGTSFGEKTHEVLDSDFDDISEKHEDEIIENVEENLPEFDTELHAAEDGFGGSILEDEDEGPIALTPEELGNIESDTDEMETSPAEDVAAPTLLDEEDEGPIAFDEGEMAGILENVEEETAEMPYGVDLDELDTTAAPAVEEKLQPEKSDIKKEELKKMISYLDTLFDELPEETVRKFSNSEYFELYKKIMSDLDIQG